MKWSFVILLFSCSMLTAQKVDKIALSKYKTVSLVFPSPIVNVDRGTEQVFIQRSAENILKVKAAADSFPESNLTVITADGKLYPLIVQYDADPVRLAWYFGDTGSTKAIHPLSAICEKVLKLKYGPPAMKFSSGKVSLQMARWFISGDKLYCKLKFSNRSRIGYDVEQFQLYIRDNVVARRTASQEIIQQPVYVHGDTGTIKAGSSRIWIIVLNKFTIPDDKHFAIEVLEKNGGRHLYLRSFEKQLMNAKEF
jgi:conjugative transposon TraN protein